MGATKQNQVWYFTFGYGHDFPKRYVKLQGSRNIARLKMVGLFGLKWAFQYSEEEFKGQKEKYGLIELKPEMIQFAKEAKKGRI